LEERQTLGASPADTAALADLRSPVYVVRGQVFRGIPIGTGVTFSPVTLWDYKIGQYAFDKQKVVEHYRALANTLRTGDVAEFEFSPRSRMVWKVERVVAPDRQR
jgi:hypothetical protein